VSGGVDEAVERLGRWTAGRTTRRSFLNRLGQVAVFVAAGPVITNLLLRRAEARVCGQTGITPKCATFDCVGAGHVWGWCWYASDGCCRNGGLKKICDCCVVNYPNVHGYCPAGTNVMCIVESCGNDPRQQTVRIPGVARADHDVYFTTAARVGFASAGTAVAAGLGRPLDLAVAAPLAGVVGGPLLALGAGGPTAEQWSLLRSSGVRRVLLVGGALGVAVEQALTAGGVQVRRVSSATAIGPLGVEVANHIRGINDINRTITETGLSRDAIPAAAALGALAGFPLLVGSAAAASVGRPTLYVGPEPATTVAGERTVSTSLTALTLELADLAAASRPAVRDRVAIAPTGTTEALGMVNTGAPLVLHPPGALGPVEAWLGVHQLRYGPLTEVARVLGPGQLSTEEYWRLQGAVNGYGLEHLMGQAGQGLPVFSQPLSERPVGAARRTGAPSYGSDGPPSYWTSAGQTFRG
jgi:hypothetical protein